MWVLVVALFSPEPGMPPIQLVETASEADCRAALVERRRLEHGRIIWSQCARMVRL